MVEWGPQKHRKRLQGRRPAVTNSLEKDTPAGRGPHWFGLAPGQQPASGRSRLSSRPVMWHFLGAMSAQLGSFLVVEDEPQAAENLVRLLHRIRPTQFALTIREAKEHLARHAAWTGLIADIGLPDGSGLDVVRFARERYPILPVLVLTGHHDRSSINRSHELRAEFVCKPASEGDLFGFVRRAIAFERIPDQRVASLIDEVARQCSLTTRETEILAAALSDTTRAQLLAQFGVTDNTLKSQIRALLRKTDHESLDSLTKAVLRQALEGGRASSPLIVPGLLEED